MKLKVKARIPVMLEGVQRRMVPDGKGGQRDAAFLLPEDGAVEVADTRYYRRRIAVGDLVEVTPEKPAAPAAVAKKEP